MCVATEKSWNKKPCLYVDCIPMKMMGIIISIENDLTGLTKANDFGTQDGLQMGKALKGMLVRSMHMVFEFPKDIY